MRSRPEVALRIAGQVVSHDDFLRSAFFAGQVHLSGSSKRIAVDFFAGAVHHIEALGGFLYKDAVGVALLSDNGVPALIRVAICDIARFAAESASDELPGAGFFHDIRNVKTAVGQDENIVGGFQFRAAEYRIAVQCIGPDAEAEDLICAKAYPAFFAAVSYAVQVIGAVDPRQSDAVGVPIGQFLAGRIERFQVPVNGKFESVPGSQVNGIETTGWRPFPAPLITRDDEARVALAGVQGDVFCARPGKNLCCGVGVAHLIIGAAEGYGVAFAAAEQSGEEQKRRVGHAFLGKSHS